LKKQCDSYGCWKKDKKETILDKCITRGIISERRKRDKNNMPDVINHVEDIETGTAELWITIKDASDLLGISERHTWRILLENGWKTKKLQNKDRKKTYILRTNVEKYYKEERERQRVEQLKAPPSSDIHDISDKSDKESLLDMSDIVKKPMSDIKNLPVLASDYRNALDNLQKRHEQLIADAVKWKTSTIWLAILAILVSVFMGFLLYDAKKTMSDNKKEMSDRINDMSDKAGVAQKELLSAKEELFQKEVAILKLEQAVAQAKIEEPKTNISTNEQREPRRG